MFKSKSILILSLTAVLIGCGADSGQESVVNVPDQTPQQQPMVQAEPEVVVPPESTVKQLICKSDHSDVQWVLDTNDFSKENPEAEYTLLRIEKADEEHGYSEVIEQTLTRGDLAGVGKTLAVTYSTTPQYLSFEVPRYGSCPSNLAYVFKSNGLKNPCEETVQYSISRETLTGEVAGWDRTVVCAISTYNMSSNQI